MHPTSEHCATACWTSAPGKQCPCCLTCSDNLWTLSTPCLSPVYSQQWPQKQSRLLNKTARCKGWICQSTPLLLFYLHKDNSVLWGQKWLLPPALPGLFEVIALGLQPSICARFSNLYFCWIIQQSKDLLLAISNLKEKTKACIWFIKTARRGKKNNISLLFDLIWDFALGTGRKKSNAVQSFDYGENNWQNCTPKG